jgi:hypothetical protein
VTARLSRFFGGTCCAPYGSYLSGPFSEQVGRAVSLVLVRMFVFPLVFVRLLVPLVFVRLFARPVVVC